MKIKNHKIYDNNGKQVPFTQTPKVSGKISPDTIIIHYTAGSGTDNPDKTDTAVRVLTKPLGEKPEASAHIVVGIDGRVFQLSDLNTKTWHAGPSEYGNRKNFNGFSIGIEISNPGYLKEVDGKLFYYWDANAADPKKAVDKNNAVFAQHRNESKPRWWAKYPQSQIEVVFDLCKAICEEYDIQMILGHEEIRPGKKSDPGPAFPLDELREKLLNKGEAMPPETTGTVAVDSLNIRLNPTSDAEKIAEPLKLGHPVKLLKESGDWYKVSTEITGWVYKTYVDMDNSDTERDAHINIDNLNIRSGPGSDNEKVALPLSKGTPVEFIKEEDAWLNVSVEIIGWVSKKYIKIK